MDRHTVSAFQNALIWAAIALACFSAAFSLIQRTPRVVIDLPMGEPIDGLRGRYP